MFNNKVIKWLGVINKDRFYNYLVESLGIVIKRGVPVSILCSANVTNSTFFNAAMGNVPIISTDKQEKNVLGCLWCI